MSTPTLGSTSAPAKNSARPIPAAAKLRPGVYGQPTARWNRLRGQLDEFRSRFVYKLLDAVLTAGFETPVGTASLARGQARSGSSNYTTAQSLITFLVRHVPTAMESVREILSRPTDLPFAAEDVQILGFGSGATVFLVNRKESDAKQPPLVLKVFRKTLGRRLDVLLDYVRQRRQSYEIIASWHASSSVVVPTHFVLLQGPPLATRAAACLQPYVASEKIDPFQDLSENELHRLIERNPSLAMQFRRFAKQILCAVETQGWCVDLVGRDNLVLVGIEREPKLQLLDYGVFHLELKREHAPEVAEEMERRIVTLRRIVSQTHG